MKLLKGVAYDPATAVTKNTTAALAMTAIDTTNLRLSGWTVPASGIVAVRLAGMLHGATTFPQVLLGVLEGSTVRFRHSPIGAVRGTALATTHLPIESFGIVSGLTGGATPNWDAAYGVETLVASTGLKYGGPNNTTANDAFGAFIFEIWDPN